MANELERLRADLEVFERYAERQPALHHECDRITREIARLEAESDPWRKAKEYFDRQRERAKEDDIGILPLSDEAKHALAYHDHVVAENERLAARVAELEAKKDTADEITTDYSNFSQAAKQAYEKARKTLKPRDVSAEFEGLGLEPELDPDRVLATARTHMNNSRNDMHGSIAYLMWCHVKESQNAKPYRVKGTDDGE